jgi:hypothetical protein
MFLYGTKIGTECSLAANPLQNCTNAPITVNCDNELRYLMGTFQLCDVI